MKNRNFGLDVVRACAILPVMIEHFFMIALPKPPSWLWPAGGFGVSLFFVLSGFLIGGIILRDFEPRMQSRGVMIFYVRRWMRTIPLYWTFLIVAIFATIQGVRIAPELGSKCLLYIPFLQNFAWPLQADWYQESWSLAVEEWFYLLFPLLFIAIPFTTTRRRVTAIAMVMTIVPFVLRVIVFAKTYNTAVALQGIVFLKLDGIAAGIFAVLLWKAHEPFIHRQRFILFGIGILGTALCYTILLGKFGNHPWFLVAVWPSITSVCLCMLMLGCQSMNWQSLCDSHAGSIINWISTRSYALYLCHGAIIRLILGEGYMWRGLNVSLPIFIVASILIAETVHRLIEKPFMRMRPHAEQNQQNGLVMQVSHNRCS